MLFLIGMRGSGKTTIGRALAERTGHNFLDLDQLVRAQFADRSISEIWRAEGEPAWRAMESRVIHEILQSNRRGIVALGGGAPLIPDVAELLNASSRAGHARIIWLRARAATLTERLRHEDPDHRPALTSHGALDEVPALLAQRALAYEALATAVINVDDADITELVELLIRRNLCDDTAIGG